MRNLDVEFASTPTQIDAYLSGIGRGWSRCWAVR